MSALSPMFATKLNTQHSKHVLLALVTVAAASLCVPSAGASAVRSSITPISSSSVSGSQSTSVTTTAIGHNRVPTRGGHGGGHGGGHSGGHSSGHSRSGSSHRSSKQRHFRSGYVGSSYSDYDDDEGGLTYSDEAETEITKLTVLAVSVAGAAGLGLYRLGKSLDAKEL